MSYTFNPFTGKLDALGKPAGGITSLNSLTAVIQTFAVGTAGTDFAIVSATSTHTFNLPTASASNRGALSSTDWSTFNGKQNALSFGNLTELTSDILTIAGGTGAVIGSGVTILVKLASGTQSGYLSSGDWTTFNGKQAALSFGNLTAASNKITIGGTGTGALVGAGATVDVAEANLTLNNIGGTLGVSKGGTNLTTVALGSVLVANTGDVISALTSTTGTKYLKNTAGVISWDTVVGGSTGILLMANQGWPSTTAGCAALAQNEETTNKVNFKYFAFDKATKEYAEFNLMMPSDWDAGTITAKFIWTVTLGAGYSDVTPTMTSNTAPSPYVASAKSVIDGGHLAFCAFDRVTGSADTPGLYHSGSETGHWLKLDFGSGNGKAVTRYRFLTRNQIDSARYAPKTWTFEGSNDNASWDTLDTKTDQADPGQASWSPYHTFANVTAYRYYRFSVSVTYDNVNYMAIDEFRMDESLEASGDIIWGCQARSHDDGGVLDQVYGTAQTITDSYVAENTIHETSVTPAITIPGATASKFTQVRIYRDAAAGGDTLDADAWLLGVLITYTKS